MTQRFLLIMPRSVDHQFTICQPLPVQRKTAVEAVAEALAKEGME